MLIVTYSLICNLTLPLNCFLFILEKFVATYDYMVEVTNRFKGFDLIDRVPDELWREVHDIVHEAVIKTIPK